MYNVQYTMYNVQFMNDITVYCSYLYRFSTLNFLHLSLGLHIYMYSVIYFTFKSIVFLCQKWILIKI